MGLIVQAERAGRQLAGRAGRLQVNDEVAQVLRLDADVTIFGQTEQLPRSWPSQENILAARLQNDGATDLQRLRLVDLVVAGAGDVLTLQLILDEVGHLDELVDLATTQRRCDVAQLRLGRCDGDTLLDDIDEEGVDRSLARLDGCGVLLNALRRLRRDGGEIGGVLAVPLTDAGFGDAARLEESRRRSGADAGKGDTTGRHYDAFVTVEAVSSRTIITDAAEICDRTDTGRQRDLK